MESIAEFFANLLNKLFFENKDNNLKVQEHPYFSRMRTLISSVDYKLEFKNNGGREKIIEDILVMMFYSAKKELKEFAKKIDNNKDINVRECFWNHIMKHKKHYNNIDNYRKKFRDFNRTDEETLKITLKKFNKWHSDNIDKLRERSEDVKNSKFYKGNKVKACVLLDYCSSFFNKTLKAAQITLKHLDGDISDNVYRGVRIEKLDKEDFKERINSESKPEFRTDVKYLGLNCHIKLKNFDIKGSLLGKKAQLYDYKPNKYTPVKIIDLSKNGISVMFEDDNIYNIFLLNRSNSDNITVDFSQGNCDIDLTVNGRIKSFIKDEINGNKLGIRFTIEDNYENLISDWIATLSLKIQDLNIKKQDF